MKINQNTKITGEKIILVPYRKIHVLKYHKWMQDPAIQHLTASEPLTLQEEYQMQQTWRDDDDKCTFILLDRALFESTQDEVESMIGDVNLFLHVGGDTGLEAELEVMIAEPDKRGHGRGQEACLLIMRYGIEKLNVNSYVVKIGFDNDPSRKLFTKLGFREQSRSDVFQEVTYVLGVTDETLIDIIGHTSSCLINIHDYETQ